MNRGKAKSDDDGLVARAIEELPYVTLAFEELAQRHYGVLYRYCYSILREPREAEDMCQVVLMKVFTGLPRFEARSSFRTWLFKIAANACYSQRQKLVVEKARLVELDETKLASVADTNTPVKYASEKHLFANLVAGLSEREQDLLGLRFIGDLSFEEISEITGLGLSATKMRYYRAIDKIANQMGIEPSE